MSERSVEHNTFVIERRYPVPPARVYTAWADPAAKAEWFGGAADHYEIDFRVGGRELSRGKGPGDVLYTYDARYEDIVPDERIVMTYFMLIDDTRISVSVASIEFRPVDDGTALVYTEHGVYLDGHDQPIQREHGTNELLTALEKFLAEKGPRT